MIYWTEPMLSTSSAMISIECHTSSRWVTSLATFAEGQPCWTPSQASPAPIWAIHHHQGRRWQCLRGQHPTVPWSAPSFYCRPPSAILSTIVGRIWHCKTSYTNRSQPWLHGICHNWSSHGHISRTLTNRGYSYIELSKQVNSFTSASGSPGTRFNKNFLTSWRLCRKWG